MHDNEETVIFDIQRILDAPSLMRSERHQSGNHLTS